MQLLLKVSRLIDRSNELIGRWVYWLVLVAVLVSAGNAIVRKVFNMSSNAFLELQWYLFSAVFLFSAGFTLLITHGTHDDADVKAMQNAAAKLNIPLQILAPDHPSLATLYAARFALVRPDQHIAWRGDHIGDAAEHILKTVTGMASD